MLIQKAQGPALIWTTKNNYKSNINVKLKIKIREYPQDNDMIKEIISLNMEKDKDNINSNVWTILV